MLIFVGCFVRFLLNWREQYVSFTIKWLRVSAGVRKDVSVETVRRVLRGAGYRFLHSRKESILKNDDPKKRWKFVRNITEMLSDKFLEESISFYIYAAGLQHIQSSWQSTVPINYSMEIKNEIINPNCTAKGFYVGSRGIKASFG